MTRVAFQGRRGAYSESAAYHLFGTAIQVHPVDTFEEIHRMVQSGAVDGGVIPIENSTAGSILDNYDLLFKYRLPIVGEVKLQIEHCLMALPGTKVKDLREVISHPQALAQCSNFFATHPATKAVAFFDTAGSAEEIAQKNLVGTGAIASAFAAKHYGLDILIDPLANLPGNNFTRFFAIQREPLPRDIAKHTKSSLVFAPQKNQAGILYLALGCFASRHINLIRIESRPKTGSPWEYLFYLDYEGNPSMPHVAEALADLEKISAFVYSLGSYANGELRTVSFQ